MVRVKKIDNKMEPVGDHGDRVGVVLLLTKVWDYRTYIQL